MYWPDAPSAFPSGNYQNARDGDNSEFEIFQGKKETNDLKIVKIKTILYFIIKKKKPS